eukprot:11223979-Lingulodinium_polyedra.AAC.1
MAPQPIPLADGGCPAGSAEAPRRVPPSGLREVQVHPAARQVGGRHAHPLARHVGHRRAVAPAAPHLRQLVGRPRGLEQRRLRRRPAVGVGLHCVQQHAPHRGSGRLACVGQLP